jgi:serine protease inhibitor ecotin
MDIVDSKVSNNMGYAYLVLNKVSQQASDIATKSEKKDLVALF